MLETCEWLHKVLAPLPVVAYPFDLKRLPRNGIYFLYEQGEACGHHGHWPRIVRVGTHKEGNFRSRISEHFLLNERRMNFDVTRPRPHDRSIFRKNIGRALLNRERDPYLEIWEVDMTPSANRAARRGRRDIDKEKQIEGEVTRILRERFSFRFVVLEGQEKRMGSEGIESRLIGTLAGCQMCQPSPAWLGLHSPKPKIRQSGLWLEQHLDAPALDDADRETLVRAIANTQRWEADNV
jgi:hypothetical protein